MDNCNNHYNFDFSEAVVIRERINNVKIGKVRSATYGEKPSVTSRDDGDNYNLDFVLPLPDGCFEIDDEMSDTSTNPASNATVKNYVDSGRTTITPIYTSTFGTTAYAQQDLLAGYDLVICYASPTPDISPSCYCIPLLYLEDVSTSPMEVKVSDNELYTVFKFSRNGFFTEKYNGTSGGKIYGMYGVKIR